MSQTYRPLEIKNFTEKDSDFMAALVRLCGAAIWLKEHVSVDSEWDYKLGKPFADYSRDIEHLAQMPTGIKAKNTYTGELTVDTLLAEFRDFNELLSSTYPLDTEDVDFVISYGFLEGKLNFLKSIFSSAQKIKRPKNIERKTDWGMWGTVATIGSILVAILLAVAFH